MVCVFLSRTGSAECGTRAKVASGPCEVQYLGLRGLQGIERALLLAWRIRKDKPSETLWTLKGEPWQAGAASSCREAQTRATLPLDYASAGPKGKPVSARYEAPVRRELAGKRPPVP